MPGCAGESGTSMSSSGLKVAPSSCPGSSRCPSLFPQHNAEDLGAILGMAPLAGLTGSWGTLILDVGREPLVPWELSMRDCEEDSCARWGILIGTRDVQGLGLG